MNRALGTTAAVIVAAVVAFLMLRRDDAPDAASAPIERLLAAGKVGEARVELARRRPRLDSATADYLDGLALLTEGKDREAADVLDRARKARPTDWRIVSAAAAATANTGRHRQALVLVENYVAAAPDDERGLAAVAQYRLDRRAGTPDGVGALAALDRLAALPRRVAPPDDPTAVPDAKVRLMRTQALILVGRCVEAYGEATTLTRETPQDPEAWFLLGEAARRMAPPKPEEALAAYRQAVELAPRNRVYGEQFIMTTLDFVIPGTELARNAEAMQVVDSLLAQRPDDAAFQILKARLLAHGDPTDYARMDAAADIYRGLTKRDLTDEQRLAVLRNLAVLLFDVKRGGRPGEYADEAYGLLKEYFRLGGKDDAKLHDTWETLDKRAKETPPPAEKK